MVVYIAIICCLDLMACKLMHISLGRYLTQWDLLMNKHIYNCVECIHSKLADYRNRKWSVCRVWSITDGSRSFIHKLLVTTTRPGLQPFHCKTDCRSWKTLFAMQLRVLWLNPMTNLLTWEKAVLSLTASVFPLKASQSWREDLQDFTSPTTRFYKYWEYLIKSLNKISQWPLIYIGK